MAGTGSDPQKQFLSLIRNFATEKSQGERRVVTLRKRCKELVEQELKGFEVQLFMIEASVQTLEARVSLIQDEIAAVGSDSETIKSEEAALCEQFINNMLELNAKIRKFHESIITCDFDAVDGEVLTDAPDVIVKESDAEVALMSLESTLLDIISQTAKEEEEYQAEQKIYKNIQQELIDCERKVSLINIIVTETKALQDLTMQSSELEATYSSLGEELQKRCMCPSCHLDNLEAVSELLVANEEE
ncbi:PREDICTED: uncharacterized protein LOC109361015 isoform X2 [Lupinus angustifolius]|uniref:uncharacterized protein LOC109361015 isoform X2 n=1 Tax=Lupinus angustifolius TaxID=3871 RepID=UPI00092F798F|nr:PREDICTED: uncharacterized protein LOC109361015 isoform X2 [Lupinus angustifolius]